MRRPGTSITNAYATVLLRGCFEQASCAGRMRVAAGDVLVQPTLDCHADRMLSAGLTVLRLAWPRDEGCGGVHAGCDVDMLARLAERDVVEAAAALREQLACRPTRPSLMEDPADILAAALMQPDAPAINAWAERLGIARETVSRGFTRLYGVSPSRFRADARARAAWLRITGERKPLAAIAGDCGFADQAHMTRSVSRLTGATPTAWRARSHSFKTPTDNGATLPE
ncbi:AraC family transcriptional regulator [Dyella sp. LX-66]|uniref:helix-turn-helix domain-containing protein n=1 Tax=unclassified Dyella TaxID=2634549 RepID=UPI001BE00263|nr:MULTISPECIES: AraC family transcriptional regulator [unclassified Dyella]MBT2119131.1 AraC family transcriptional regulator [Dyella sp. LX-1]MBT2141502.1 AraC family transcriptional regulator [Dyella sp. LX-66]